MRISKLVNNSIIVLITLAVSIGLAGAGCDSLSGTDGARGEQGPQGEQGPVGPAGEDGSQIYAGSGAPGTDVGDLGDYYLNQDTGELYGPKDDQGWGSPGIVLMGQDGVDGQDGADGQDGEDGSQIFAGDGAPSCGLGGPGDYYLDQTNYELYGPKAEQDTVDCNTIWGVPVNLKGADGNANVTRYLYSGRDFSSSSAWANNLSVSMGIDSEGELAEYAFIVYFKRYSAGTNTTYYYPIPGYGASNSSYYKLMFYWSGNYESAYAQINLIEGTGEAYDQIEIIRIENSNTADHTKSMDNKNSIIPDDLDVSDYEAVARYYGFYNN